MSTFKKTKVVMLSTNEKADLQKYGRSLRLRNSGYYPHVKEILGYYQHLYFLSDEEIKEGDWVYNEISKEIYQFKENRVDYEKKIIATTDKSLKNYGKGVDKIMNTFNDTFADYLPQPSQSFIEKFVDEYNKGNQITDVLVEYEKILVGWEPDYSGEHLGIEGSKNMYENFLKINHKDNTITIRKAKDSWSREEVKQLFDKMYALTDFVDINVIKVDFDKWIEENL